MATPLLQTAVQGSTRLRELVEVNGLVRAFYLTQDDDGADATRAVHQRETHHILRRLDDLLGHRQVFESENEELVLDGDDDALAVVRYLDLE